MPPKILNRGVGVKSYEQLKRLRATFLADGERVWPWHVPSHAWAVSYTLPLIYATSRAVRWREWEVRSNGCPAMPSVALRAAWCADNPSTR